jgi:hypothetical protein
MNGPSRIRENGRGAGGFSGGTPRRRTAAVVLAVVGLLVFSAALAAPVRAKVLVPMDLKQTDHLKAYGLAFWVLQQGQTVEWLLNYRGGSFLMEEDPAIIREARIRGVRVDPSTAAQVTEIYTEIETANMDVIMLEKAPRVAIYIPPGFVPWDDAVTLAFTYAEIPYTAIWDPEVIRGELGKYDWLHLHHEDFTGQYGKFYAAFRDRPWYRERVATYEASARSLGFGKVSDAKRAVVETMRDWVARGGFLFAMCSATDTFDIALASAGLDICERMYDGDPADPSANSRLDFTRTLAFKDFQLVTNPMEYEFSNIDMTRVSLQRGERNDYFSLFEFSAKQDPVPTMLTQNHTSVVKGFLGQTTSFNKPLLKDGVLVMGETEGAQDSRYLHGNFGQGTFTWLGGHDPEDWQHAVGDPPTNLALHKNSPGYRLILNNVLFPAAEKKKQKT